MGAPPISRARRRSLLAARAIALACAAVVALHLPASGPSASAAGTAGAAAARQLDPLDVSTPSQLHGRLHKHGPLGVLALLGQGMRREDLCFPEAWRRQRLAGAAPPLPARWCSIFYSDRYKIIFVKSAKTAGSSLMRYFTSCEGSPRPQDRCLRAWAPTNATDVAHLNAAWADYFVFGFSRNVLRRAVSEYQYLTTFVRQGGACPRPPSWATFCADPHVLGDYCAAPGAARCCRESAEHQYLHVAPQANCLATLDGRVALDWLGRVEQLAGDFAELLAALNARPGVPQLPRGALGRRKFNASPCTRRRLAWHVRPGVPNPCDAGELFRGRHVRCRASVARFYAEDITLLAANTSHVSIGPLPQRPATA